MENSKNSKFLGMVRDALGGVGGSSLSIFTGFSKDFEKLNFQNLKFVKNRFKTGRPSASRRPRGSKIRRKAGNGVMSRKALTIFIKVQRFLTDFYMIFTYFYIIFI